MIIRDNPVKECGAQEDLETIQNILSGKNDSFSLLLEKYREKVRNMVYFITNDKSCVDDLTQDIFIKVYESLRYFRYKSSFYTWLYKITVNRCRDEIRRKKIRKFVSVDSFIDYHNEKMIMPDEYQKIENSLLITEALGKLKYDHKEILLLKEVNDLSYQEISEILNCEVGTVKSRLSRARLELANIISKMTEVNNV
jgi:RNA polymerase sigma-70 factor, ECF subfamily